MEQVEDQSPPNPAGRPLVTFDNNVVISLRNNDSETEPARQLLALSHTGVITTATTLSTALEKQVVTPLKGDVNSSRQHFLERPAMIGQPESHRRRALSVATHAILTR